MSGDRIVPARPEHLDALPAIEREAARLFDAYDLIDDADDTTGADELAEAQREGRLWVAIAADGAVAGFALADRHGGHAHLEEVDVAPEHGRRGLGGRLVGAVCAWARDEALGQVTLTTFRDIPWNAPFYRKLGFEVVPAGEWSEALREIVDDEAARGLDPARRVVMRRRV